MVALDSNQLQYRKLAREFAEREILPSLKTSDGSNTVSNALLEKVRALGLINVRIPEEYGGLGLKTIDACIIAEEFAAADSSIATSIEASELASSILLCLATAKQKHCFLNELASTTGFAGLALDCPDDPTALTLQVVSHQEEYVLNGRCNAVINARIADLVFVLARFSHLETPSLEEASGNWAAFIIPTKKLPGIKVLDSNRPLGNGSLDIAVVEFDNVKVPRENRLQFTDSLKALWQAVSYGNFPIIASGCIGIARSAMLHAIGYAKERIAFGQPIAKHQAVSFILADMSKDIEAARQMTWQAALAADLGKEDTILANSCKAFAQEMVMKVTTEAVQVLGAYGYCREYPTERLMRDAAFYQLVCGNSRQLQGNIGKGLLS
jgi:acyl-CoA dehydrogenase